MSVASTTQKIIYAGNGSTTVFPVPFGFYKGAEVEVWLRDESVSPPTEAKLANPTNYVLSGLASSGQSLSASVSMVTAPTASQKLLVRRVVPLTQGQTYSDTAAFPASLTMQALDELTMQAQQLAEETTRSVRLSPGTDPANFDPHLPTDIAGLSNAGRALGTDATGTKMALGPTFAQITGAAGAAAAALASQTAAAGSATAAAGSATAAAASATAASATAASIGYNVKNYGALGNGTTDDTAAVNAAIAAASAAGGGTVFFPPSTAGYLVSSTITIPANVALQGTTRDNTVIKAKAGFTGTFVLSTTAINVALRDLIVHCNSIGNLSGISISSTGAIQATIARVKVIGLAKASPWNNIGIFVKGFNCALTDIEIDGGVIYGIQLNSASDAFVGNILCVNSDIGMALYSCEQVTIASAQMDSCNTNYLQIDLSHDVSVNGFHAFFNATVYSTTNNQVGILLGTVGNSYSAPNVNSDIQLSNITLRNFGQGTAADIGIQLVACENLVMSNVSIANSTNSYTAGGTIGVGLKYSQGSNPLSGSLSNLNFKGLTTNESGSAPVSNWMILSDQIASNTANIATNTANIASNTSGISAINAAKGAASGFASLDGSGKVPTSQLPSVVMEFQGSWNPNTNTPALSDASGTAGNVYWVSAAKSGAVSGLANASMTNFQIGDLVIYSAASSQWELSSPAAGVQSVNGAQGVVSITTITGNAGTATAPASGSAHGAVTLDGSGNFESVAPGAAGGYLRSNGTDFVRSTIQAGDVPTLNQSTTGNAATATTATTATAPATGSAHGAVALDASGNFKSVAPGTNGNVLQSNGTDWVSAAPAATTYTAPTVQKFTSGSGTYTKPAGVLYIRVRMVGGGGGGGGVGNGTSGAASTSGGNGGNSTFGTSLLSAGGGGGGGSGNAGGSNGPGAGGTSSLGTGPVGLAPTGSYGSSGDNQPSSTSQAGGSGGASAFAGAGPGGLGGLSPASAAATNTGGGGGGAGGTTTCASASGGGSGGFVDAIISGATLSSTFAYSVGAAGTAGSGGSGTQTIAGAAGGSGVILVEEFYQ